MPAAIWNKAQVEQLYALPLITLLFKAQTIHQENFNASEVECCTLLNIKTGACPEDCAYCTQSGHYKTGLQKEKLMELDTILQKAQQAKQQGATRFCMGAAWRNPPEKGFVKVLEVIKEVKALGLETCVTLGMLDQQQAAQLKEAGLDYYNHNLDTSPAYYQKIVSTHTYQDRLDTLAKVRAAGIHVCCGGIIGLGEARDDRIELLLQLANLPQPPESVPINRLVPMPGTPLAHLKADVLDNFEFIKTVALARIMMPRTMVRLSAGRLEMSAEMQTLCFMAGANSIHMGEKLLTTNNPLAAQDMQMLENLGMQAKMPQCAQQPCKSDGVAAHAS